MLRDKIVKSSHYKKKIVVTDVNKTYGEHFTIYRYIKSLSYMSMIFQNYIYVLKNLRLGTWVR